MNVFTHDGRVVRSIIWLVSIFFKDGTPPYSFPYSSKPPAPEAILVLATTVANTGIVDDGNRVAYPASRIDRVEWSEPRYEYLDEPPKHTHLTA